MRLKYLLLPLLVAIHTNISAQTALFTNFTYTGQDTYYNETPLQNEHQFYNPILPGWYSDPSICRVGNDYYLVASTFGYFPGVPIFHSTDLVNWRQIGNVLDRPSQLAHLSGQSLDRGGIYAPTIRFNQHNKTFYMITTDVGWGNFYVTAKNPAGPWSDPTLLPDVDGIDPSFFFDDDGQAYIVHKEDTEGKPKWSNHRCIQIIRFDVASGQTVGPNVPFNEEGVGPEEHLGRDEGPHLYKINGKYYLLCAEGGTGNFHSEVCYRADSVFGPYTRWSRNPMLTQRLLNERRSNPVTCAGHVDMVDTPEGEWWGVFLASRPVNNGFENLGRETFIMPVKWSKDGFPYMTQEKDTVPLILSRNNAERGTDVTFGNFTWTDDFTSPKLRPEWMTLWGDATAFYKLDKGLHLMCKPNTLTKAKTPAYVGRRLQHHKFTVEVSMQFKPTSNTRAGLMIVKNGDKQYYLCRDVDGINLFRMSHGKATAMGPGLKLGAKEKNLRLRVVSTGTKFAFFVSTNGSKWLKVGDDVDAGYLSTRYSGGFTGTTIGMFAEKL